MASDVALWDAERSYERVALEDLEVELAVGVADWEKVPGRSQRLLISVEMYRHRGAFEGVGLADCLDYDRIYRHVADAWTAARAHTDLLETLVEELVALCFEDRRVEACRVGIRKPEVYSGRAVPLVEVYRRRRDGAPG